MKDFVIKNPKIAQELADHQDRATAAAVFDNFTVELEETQKAKSLLPVVLGKVDVLEKALARPVEVKMPTPAKPKATMKLPQVKDALVSAAMFEFLFRTKKISYEEAAKRFLPGDDNRLVRKYVLGMLKSATETGQTTAAGFASELVSSDVLDFWSQMEGSSVIGQLVAKGFVTPLEWGNNNSLTVPSRGAGTELDMRASWVAQSASIPVVAGQLASQTLYQNKLAAISVFTNELADTSIPNIRNVIETFILGDTAIAIDQEFLSANAGTAALNPGGIRQGIAPTTPVASDPVGSLGALFAAMAQNRARRPVLICDPATDISLRMANSSGLWTFRDEIERSGTIFGVPLVVSTNAPVGLMTIVDIDAVYIGLGVPIIDVSASASIVMIDDSGVAPTMLGVNAVTEVGSVKVSDAAGTTPASEVVSVFQQNSQALRIVVPGVDWKLMGSGAVAWLDTGWI